MSLDQAKTARRRKWFRPTLGAMMVLVLVLGGALGWVARRAKVQRDALAEIRKAGGQVYYDWQFTDGKLTKEDKPRGPKWLRDALGPDVFETVKTAYFIGPVNVPPVLTDSTMAALGLLDRLEGISIHGTTEAVTPGGFARVRALHHLKVLIHQGRGDATGFLAGLDSHPDFEQICLPRALATDANMERFGRWTGLTMLMVDGRAVTDAGFSHVSSLSRLKSIMLLECQISDLTPIRDLADIEEVWLGGFRMARPAPRAVGVSLRALTKLKDLSLGGVALSDGDLGQLVGLGNLRTLEVEGIGITETGLSSVAAIPRLRDLTLIRTSIRDIAPLAPVLPRLRSLDFTDSPVTDDGLAKLGAAEYLEHLWLAGTKITDAGLAHLSGLITLSTLDLSKTRITDVGLTSMPKLQNCREINVYGTAITDAGIAEFQKTSPRTRVVRDPPEPLE